MNLEDLRQIEPHAPQELLDDDLDPEWELVDDLRRDRVLDEVNEHLFRLYALLLLGQPFQVAFLRRFRGVGVHAVAVEEVGVLEEERVPDER